MAIPPKDRRSVESTESGVSQSASIRSEYTGREALRNMVLSSDSLHSDKPTTRRRSRSHTREFTRIPLGAPPEDAAVASSPASAPPAVQPASSASSSILPPTTLTLLQEADAIANATQLKSMPVEKRYHLLNELMYTYSHHSAVIFVPIPAPPPTSVPDPVKEQYIDSLDILTRDLPPVILVHGRKDVMTTEM
eukprot:GCRY01006758.1.p1 GENE.GCRY01006758.1~~GCRY01006758.1.p1  ORF type:complete len:193 (+),score=65.89 GCRY01006758.1:888-1466(+)